MRRSPSPGSPRSPGTCSWSAILNVDIWAAVRPQRVGLDTWPAVPKGQPWKEGVLAALGRPHATQADVARGLAGHPGRVRSWTDLEPALLGRVEELIDFVTGDGADG